MKPVKWGILSTAKIGTEKVLPAMAASDICELHAIASRDEAKSREAADALDIPVAYGDYAALLADPEVEAIYNPLPNHLHVPLSVDAANKGKHVLCEKPISMNAAEINQLIEARDRNGVIVAEAFMVRHHPQWIKAREIVSSGEIGDVTSIQCAFSYFNDDPGNIRNIRETGGGALYDIGVYPIVTSRFVLGAEPDRVVGAMKKDPTFDTDIVTAALMRFGDVPVSFTCSTQQVPYQRLHIFGAKGRVEVEIPFNAPPNAPTRIFVDDGSVPGGASAREITFDVCDQYHLQGEAFSRAVRGKTALEFGLEDSVANMSILDAIFQSADTGSWVDL